MLHAAASVINLCSVTDQTGSLCGANVQTDLSVSMENLSETKVGDHEHAFQTFREGKKKISSQVWNHVESGCKLWNQREVRIGFNRGMRAKHRLTSTTPTDLFTIYIISVFCFFFTYLWQTWKNSFVLLTLIRRLNAARRYGIFCKHRKGRVGHKHVARCCCLCSHSRDLLQDPA